MTQPLRHLQAIGDQLPDPPYPATLRAKGMGLYVDLERVRQSTAWVLCPPSVRPWLMFLWIESWSSAPIGTYVNDDEVIAARIGADPAFFLGNRKYLMRGWYLCSDGLLYHPHITELALAMSEVRRKDRARVAAWRAESFLSRVTPMESAAGSGSGSVKNPLSPVGGESGFQKFWDQWPAHGRKIAQPRAMAAWIEQGCDACTDAVLAGLQRALVSQEWQRQEGRFIPKPWRWLQDRAWEAPAPAAPAAKADDQALQEIRASAAKATLPPKHVKALLAAKKGLP